MNGSKPQMTDVSVYSENDTTNGHMHIVVQGDTLFGIARRYGLSIEELKRKNRLTVDTIFVGQKLICQ
jgi:LysM repeat protein